LRLAKEQLPGLIVLDIMMPLMDGRDICKKLKNDPETKNIKDLSSASLRNWPALARQKLDNASERKTRSGQGIMEYWNGGMVE